MAWNRIILPDTSLLALHDLASTDHAGYAGLEDGTNWHWLTTLLGVGAELPAPIASSLPGAEPTGQREQGWAGNCLAQSQYPTYVDGAAWTARAHHRQPRSGAAAVPAAVLQSGDLSRKLWLRPSPKTENSKLTFSRPASLKADLDQYAVLHE